MIRPTYLSPLFAALLLSCAASLILTAAPDPVTAPSPVGSAPGTATDFPIWIELEKPQLVTVVIEDSTGKRVRNLVAELPLPAGRNRLSWDGYDDGVQAVPFVQRHDQVSVGDVTRTRVPPGTYRARGLTHDGIELKYELTAYSGGNPPWPTKDRTGAWLADHSSPLGAVFLPAKSGSPYGDGESQVLLTSLIAEAGAPLVWVNLDGKTLQRRHLWGWSGAIAAARDAGPSAVPDIYAYLVIASENSIGIRVLRGNGTGSDLLSFKPDKPGPKEPRHEGHSLAVHNGLVVFSAVTDDALVFADVASAKVIAKLPMPKPRGLLFDAQGRLLVISDNKVLRYTVKRPSTVADGKPMDLELTERREIIATGLERPWTLAFDPAGKELFVTDWGTRHQVKVFTPEGKPLRGIGKPSDGQQLGVYDEGKMQMPMGLAPDDRGQLWVVEGSHLPKRVSVWNVRTGAHLRSHYGPPKYGGGGNVDPTDKSRFFYNDYYGLMEFALDWKAGTAKPRAILVNAGNKLGKLAEAYGKEYDPALSRWGFVGSRPTRIGDRTYIMGNRVVWMIGKDDIAWPVGFVGGTGFSFPPDINASFTSALQKAGLKNRQILASWSDRNGNHKIDPEEYSFRQMSGTWVDGEGKTEPIEGFVQENYHADLSMTANWGLHVPAPTFDANGIPSWDLGKASFIMEPDPMFRFGESDPHWGSAVIPTSDGWIISKAGWGGWRNGQRMWTYPVQGADPPPWVGGQVVHPRPGMMGRPTKASSGEAGHWYAINGEKGNMFLMTTDGLYLQTLGGDMRTTPLLRFPTAERGMLIDAPGKHISFEDEHYNPTITETDAGEIYLVAGKEHCSIFRVDGFPSIRRRTFGDLTLNAATLAKLPEKYVIPSRRQNVQTLKIEVGGTKPVVDGKLDEYNFWAPLGVGRQASVRIHGTHLYAAWRTGDPQSLVNAGGDWKYLFKRGGTVDLMIQTDTKLKREGRDPFPGDLRLLVTKVDGKPVAVIYRQVMSGAPESGRVLFDSPVGSVSFDSVENISDQVTLVQTGGDIEISIPLETLRFNPAIGDSISADLGLTRGDGGQTVQRVYWNNLNTFIVSDIPSEARLQPGYWGLWNLIAAVPPLPVLKPLAPPAGAIPGLRAARYKGKWEKLPDFSALTPTVTTVAPIPALIGDDKDPNEFGLEFTGFIRIPTDGDWTFITHSNDGSRLWLGGSLLVDNDGVHWGQDESRTIRLTAGTYPIRVGYFQFDSGKKFQVRWKGPGVADQPIPADVFTHAP